MKKEKKIAYVTGGMGGIGTAICRKLYSLDYVVVAGCGPNRDFTSWLTTQRKDGYDFLYSVGNVSDWESTKTAFKNVNATLIVLFGNGTFYYLKKRSYSVIILPMYNQYQTSRAINMFC